MNTIQDLAKESYIPWGVIAGKIDNNFKELETNVEGVSGTIKNLDLTAYKNADASSIELCNHLIALEETLREKLRNYL